MKNCFTGQRVRLRALEPQDVEIWVENDRNKDTDMSRCDDCIPLPRPEWMLRQDFPERIKRESEMQSYRFVIENKEGQVVGSINATAWMCAWVRSAMGWAFRRSSATRAMPPRRFCC